MTWYVSTIESFAVLHARPAPPERIDACRAPERKREQNVRAASERSARRAS